MKVSLRELDALVAEHVMGFSDKVNVRPHGSREWHVAFRQQPKGSRHLGKYDCYFDEAGTKYYAGKPCGLHFPEPYTKNHSAAFEVVARMQKDDWLLTLHRYSDFATASFWRTEKTDEVEMNAETVPVAICKAALATKGIHVEVDE